jgi:hypothetical protein
MALSTKNTFIHIDTPVNRRDRAYSMPPSVCACGATVSIEPLNRQTSVVALLDDLVWQFPDVSKVTVTDTGGARIGFRDSDAAEWFEKFLEGHNGRNLSIVRVDSNKQAPHDRYFIGGLSPETTDEGLRNYFAAFGPVKDASVILDKKSRLSRGFGFVHFDTMVPVASMERNDHVIDGKQVGIRVYGTRPV